MNKTFFIRRLFRILIYQPFNLQPKVFLNPCLSYGIKTIDYNSCRYFARKSKCSISETQKTDHSKDRLIKEMMFKSDEDAEPFYQLSIPNLLTLYKVTKMDNKLGYCTNRLYYVADLIKCEPKVLSGVIVKRTFIYTLSFDWLEASLKVLLDMGVSGERILRDLWVIKYHHETIQERLQIVKNSGCEQVYPWMVRCSNIILDRYIKIVQETKNILGDKMSTLEYLATRLDTSAEVIENMCNKVPSLWSIRVIKVKSFLDYLLSEGFTKEEIINKPRILATSQSTTSQRIAMLRSLGVTSINLNILCRGRKGFLKHVDSINTIKNIK